MMGWRAGLIAAGFCAFSGVGLAQTCADVKTFDFRNATIEVAARDDGGHAGVDSFHLRDGVAFTSDDPDSPDAHDWRVNVVLDRTVHPEAQTWLRVLVLEKDHLTGSGSWYYVLAFGCRNGKVSRVFQYVSLNVSLQHLDDAEIDLHQAVRLPGDSQAEPSWHCDLVYRWSAAEHRYIRAARNCGAGAGNGNPQ